MKRLTLIVLLLSILMGNQQGFAQEQFTLAMAIQKVESHPDYQAWLNSVEATEQNIQSIMDKQKPQLELGGQAFSYTYNLEKHQTAVTMSPALSFSQNFLSGPSFSASVSPSKDLMGTGDWKVKWNLALNHVIWPSPSLTNDRLNLSHGQNTLDMLEIQQDYVKKSVLFKIEELYRTAQLVQARLEFSHTSLRAEQENLLITEEKSALGEAGDIETLTAKISVLKAEKEYEQATINYENSLKRLQSTLDLSELPLLPALDLEDDLHPFVTLEEGFSLKLGQHPLLLQRLNDIEKAKREVSAAKETLKPGATFALSLSEAANSNELQARATITIAYSLYNGNQKQNTVQSKIENLELIQESYENELLALEENLLEAIGNVATQARDLEIAELTLAKAQLEWQVAQKQFALGTIDNQALKRHEIQFQQANLNHWETNFQYYLMICRLTSGILGDLAGTGGQNR